MYNFDHPEDSFKDSRRNETYTDDGEPIDPPDDELYIYKDTEMKYYLQGYAFLNFVISYIFEKVIVPSTTAIWNAKKIRKLKELKKKESEQALTMQQLFQISE